MDALAETPARVTVTTGPAVDPADLRAPRNAAIHRFVPHAELMPSASLVIGHGGHSTTMLALAHGLPVLVLPMNTGFDQPAIGRLVQQHGAGLTLRGSAGAGRIGEAALRILRDPSYREAARGLGTQLRGVGGAAAAADLLVPVRP
jgi:UDP:flavonoid glycosyltransferase YjiC (YdhE family)